MPRRKKTKLKTAYQVASSRTILGPRGDVVTSPPKVQASAMYQGSYPWRTRTRTLSTYQSYNTDYKLNVTEADWNTLLSRGRDIYANLGSVKNATIEIADMAVGDGWYPKFEGSQENQEWGNEAQDWLINNFFPMCDIKGPPWDFHMALKLAVVSTLRDGDCVAVLTTDKSGTFPKVQWIPAHKIGSRTGTGYVEKGPYKGKAIDKGVVYNRIGAVVAYNVLGKADDGSDDERISVFDSQMVFDPEYIDQGRGLTAYAAAINDWAEFTTIKNFELTGIKHASNFGVQMYVPEQYQGDTTDEYSDSPYASTVTPSGSRELTIETLQGGEVNVWRPDSGAKLEVLKSDRPSSNTSTFLLETCLRNAFLSLRWPIELCYDLNSRGATTKLVVAKAQRRIEAVQSQILYPIWKRIVTYALAKAIQAGVLSKNDQWWRFEPAMPRQFVLDNYKDVKSDMDMYAKGWTTGTKVAASYGYDYEQNLEEKAKELAAADRIAKKYNLNRNELVMQTIQGNAVAAPEDDKKEDEDDKTEDGSSTDGDNNDNQDDDTNTNGEER